MPRPQAVRRRTTVTRAPRSRARLISATNSRRFVAKPRTPHLHCAARAALQDQGWQCNLSLGGSRGIFSFEKENIPLDSCSATGAAIPTALCAERKKEGRAFAQPPSYAGLAAAAVIAATAIVAAAAAATAAAAAGEDQDDEDQDPQAAAAAKTTVIIAHKTNPL